MDWTTAYLLGDSVYSRLRVRCDMVGENAGVHNTEIGGSIDLQGPVDHSYSLCRHGEGKT